MWGTLNIHCEEPILPWAEWGAVEDSSYGRETHTLALSQSPWKKKRRSCWLPSGRVDRREGLSLEAREEPDAGIGAQGWGGARVEVEEGRDKQGTHGWVMGEPQILMETPNPKGDSHRDLDRVDICLLTFFFFKIF